MYAVCCYYMHHLPFYLYIFYFLPFFSTTCPRCSSRHPRFFTFYFLFYIYYILFLLLPINTLHIIYYLLSFTQAFPIFFHDLHYMILCIIITSQCCPLFFKDNFHLYYYHYLLSFSFRYLSSLQLQTIPSIYPIVYSYYFFNIILASY